MFRLSLICVFIIGVAVAQDVKVDVNGDDALGSGLKVLMRLYDDCARRDDGLSGCLKSRAITFFDRASRAKEIPIIDTISLVKSGNDVPTGRAMTEGELEAILPAADDDEREIKLDSLLMDRVAKFFSSMKLQFSLPKTTGEDLARSLGGEGMSLDVLQETGRKKGAGFKPKPGRGKKNKGLMNMLMMAMGIKMAGLIPIIIGKLFLLAGKALIISKIALVLSLIIALKKLLASKGGDHHHHGGHDHGWDRRSSDSYDAHDIVYNAHVPTQ